MDPVDNVTNPTGKPRVDLAAPTAEELAARDELMAVLDEFDKVVSPGWWRRQWNRFVRFLRRNAAAAEPTFDDLYDEILGLAGAIDEKTDNLIACGQNKKVEAQQEMDALTRQIAKIDADLSRMIGLGTHAQSLQAQIRAVREQC